MSVRGILLSGSLYQTANQVINLLRNSNLKVRDLFPSHIFMVTLKREGHQNDCPDRHWRRWRQASTSSVTIRAVILMTFPFLCNRSYSGYFLYNTTIWQTIMESFIFFVFSVFWLVSSSYPICSARGLGWSSSPCGIPLFLGSQLPQWSTVPHRWVLF